MQDTLMATDNLGHLATKLNEIENAISGFNLQIFGISEANL